MAATITALASGSSGNATLVRADGFGLLVDCGLAARTLAHRLTQRGFGWRHVDAALLSHTHGDHWSRSALSALHRHRIPLWCHAQHLVHLEQAAPRELELIREAGLFRTYAGEQWAELSQDLRALPIPVDHDAEPTFGFRLEGASSLFGPGWAVGYASDLGQWSPSLADRFAGVDVLAVEFNHDVRMQRASRRPAHLIDRVLGPLGHLSNEQAADFARAVQERSTGVPLKALIPLHRSRQCNTAELVDTAARDCLLDSATALHLADQVEPTPVIELVRSMPRRPSTPRRRPRTPSATPAMFDPPG